MSRLLRSNSLCIYPNPPPTLSALSTLLPPLLPTSAHTAPNAFYAGPNPTSAPPTLCPPHYPHCSPPSIFGSVYIRLYKVFKGFQCVPKPPLPSSPLRPPPTAVNASPSHTLCRHHHHPHCTAFIPLPSFPPPSRPKLAISPPSPPTPPPSALRLHCPSHPPHPHSNVCPNPLHPHRPQRFAHPLYAVTTILPPTAHRLHSSAIVPT